ncbi:ABC transporter substrate-binding protein [Gemmobacter sp. LW-1]|uniref:ABC transporter substrate-binding protein n=1 Tax=Gemmobacter sp. LW-1 TaxID=1529005 RepID=UPI0009E7CDD3|nr:ABC transporter substrate-binding protein [Gemmobacter sp. LW-1]
MRLTRHRLLTATAFAGLTLGGPALADDLTIGLKSEPSSLDPQFHVLSPNMQVALSIFEALTTQDSTGAVKPLLAESWALASPTEWDFKLRPGVTFSDGSPLTAADVVFTFDRVAKVPNSPTAFTLFTRKIASVTALDDATVRITTTVPYPLLLVDIVNIPILSKTAASGPAPEGRTTTEMNRGEGLIGTGPFTFVSWQKGADLVLARNEHYWGTAPAWDRVVMRPMTNPAARAAALLAGDIDMMEDLPTASIADFRANKAVNVVSAPPARSIYIALDQERDDSPGIGGAGGKNPLKDKRVREALSLAIDRAAIVERIMGGAAVAAGSLGTGTMFGTSPAHVDAPRPDTERARALLAEAGWGNGFTITLGSPSGRYVNDARVSQTVAAMWSRIGVTTAVDAVAPPVYFKNRDALDYSAYLGSWGNNTAEIGTTLTAQLMTYDKAKGQGTANGGRYSNPELDRLLDEASGTMDDAARKALLEQADALAMEDYAILPLHFEVPSWALRSGLTYAARADQFTLPQFVTTEN